MLTVWSNPVLSRADLAEQTEIPSFPGKSPSESAYGYMLAFYD